MKRYQSLHHRKLLEAVFFPPLNFQDPNWVAILLGIIFDIIGSFITPRLRASTPGVSLTPGQTQAVAGRTVIQRDLASETDDRGLKIGNIPPYDPPRLL